MIISLHSFKIFTGISFIPAAFFGLMLSIILIISSSVIGAKNKLFGILFVR